MKTKYVSEFNPYGFHEVEVNISDIKLNDKNPRVISARDKKELGISLSKFGLIDKPILNTDFTLIAGHQRVAIFKDKMIDKIICNVAEIYLSVELQEELLIRHNKNQGDFDNNKLIDFGFDKLLNFGFERKELSFFDDLKNEPEFSDPIYPLVKQANEEYSYVMILARNTMEKVFLETFFKLEKEQDYKTQRIGTGRVIEVSKFESIIAEKINDMKNLDL